MKILLTTDTYENQVCGVSSSIATLKSELINQGHDVRVLLMSRNHKSKIIKDNYLIGSFSLPFIDFRQSFRYNEKVVDEFLKEHPDFHREAIQLPDPIGEVHSGEITLWPQKHGTDGFYICRLRRSE